MLLSPLLGGPALQRPAMRHMYTSALVVTAAVITAWMLAQYAFQARLFDPDPASMPEPELYRQATVA